MLGPTIYLRGIGQPKRVHHGIPTYRQCLENLQCFSTDMSCATTTRATQDNELCKVFHGPQNRPAYGRLSKCGGNMHSSEIYIILIYGTPLALHFTFVSIWGKRVIVNQTHHFRIVVSFLLIQHSTSLWRGRIWQAQLFHRAHPHQQHSSGKKQFQCNHRCTQGLTRFGTRDTCRPMRLAQPAWHSVV